MISLLMLPLISIAQRKITPTDSFRINGKVKAEQVFTTNDLSKFTKVVINDHVIYNHKGEAKDTIRNIKGVLLTTVLGKVEFATKKPKDLNEFYFTCIASDGYKVVFSWNEIYNSDVGNNLYFITEMNGKPLKDLEQRIVLFAASDVKAGRRYIKALERITVNRTE